MMATIDSMVQRTGFEVSFTTDQCQRRAQHSYPETLLPCEIFYHEDRHEYWLTFNNINQWIDGEKQILLYLMFFKDEPCTFPGK